MVKPETFELLLDNKYFSLHEPFDLFVEEIGSAPKALNIPNTVTLNGKQYNVHSHEKAILELAHSQLNWNDSQKPIFWFKKFIFNANEHSHQWLKEFTKGSVSILENDFKRQVCQYFIEFYYQEKISLFNLLTAIILSAKDETNHLNDLTSKFVNKHFKNDSSATSQISLMVKKCVDQLCSISNTKYQSYSLLNDFSLFQKSIILFLSSLATHYPSVNKDLLLSFTDWLVKDKKLEIDNGYSTLNEGSYSTQLLETVKSLVFLHLLDIESLITELQNNHSDSAHVLTKNPSLIDSITEKICELNNYDDHALIVSVWGLILKTCFNTLFKKSHMIKYQTPVASSLSAILNTLNEEYEMEDVLSILNLNQAFYKYQRYIDIMNSSLNPLSIPAFLKDLSYFILSFIDTFPSYSTHNQIVDAFCTIVGTNSEIAQEIWSSSNPGKSVIIDAAKNIFPYDLSTYLKIVTAFIEVLPEISIISELNSFSTLTLPIHNSQKSYLKPTDDSDINGSTVNSFKDFDVPLTHWKIPIGSKGSTIKDSNPVLVQFDYQFSVFDYILDVLDYLSRTEYTNANFATSQQPIFVEDVVVALRYVLDGLPYFCPGLVYEENEQQSSSYCSRSPYQILNLILQIINYSTNNHSKFDNESIACCLQILTQLVPRFSKESWELIHKYGLLRQDPVLANYFLHLGNSPSEMIYSKIKEEIILGDYNVTIGFLDLINTLNQSIAQYMYQGDSDISKNILEDMKTGIKFIYSSIFSSHLFWKYNNPENRARIGTLCISIFSLCFDLSTKQSDLTKKFTNVELYLSTAIYLFVSDSKAAIVPLMDLVDQYQSLLNEEQPTGSNSLFDNSLDCIDHLETILSFFSRLIQHQLLTKTCESSNELIAMFMDYSIGNRAFIDILAKFIDSSISPVIISSTIVLLTQLLLSGCNSNTFLHSFTSDVNSTLTQISTIFKTAQFEDLVQSQLWNFVSSAVLINPGFANLLLFGEAYLETLNDSNSHTKSASSQPALKPSSNSIITCLKNSLNDIDDIEKVSQGIQKSLLHCLSTIWSHKSHFSSACSYLSENDYIWKSLKKFFEYSKDKTEESDPFLYQSNSYFFSILTQEIQIIFGSETTPNQPSMEFIALAKSTLKDSTDAISNSIELFSLNDPHDDIQNLSSNLKNHFGISNSSLLEKKYLPSQLDPFKAFTSDYLYSVEFLIEVISYNMVYLAPDQREIVSSIAELVDNINYVSLLKASLSMYIGNFSELLTAVSLISDEKLWPSAKDKDSLVLSYLHKISKALCESDSTSKFALNSTEYCKLIHTVQKVSSSLSIKSTNQDVGTSDSNETAQVFKLVLTFNNLSLLSSPNDLVQAFTADVKVFMSTLSCYYQLSKALESIFNVFNRNDIVLPKKSIELLQFEKSCVDMINNQVKIVDLLINLSTQDGYIETHQTIASILSCLKSLFNYPLCPRPGLWANIFDQTKVLENLSDWLLFCYQHTNPNMSSFPLVTLDFLLSLASIPSPISCLEKIGLITKFTRYNYSYYPGISENNHIVWHRILELAYRLFDHFSDSIDFQRQVTEFIKMYWTHFVGLLTSLAREDLNLSFNLLVEVGLVLQLFAAFSRSYWMLDLLRKSPEISYSISSLLSRLTYFLLHPLDTQSRFTNISYKEHMEILKYVELPAAKDSSNSLQINDEIFQGALSFRLGCVVRQLIQNSLHFLLNVDGINPHNLSNLFSSDKLTFRLMMEPKVLNRPGDQATLGTLLDMLNHEETSFNDTIKIAESKNIFKKQNCIVILNNLISGCVLLISQIALNFHNSQGDEIKSSGLAQIISETNSTLNKLGTKLDGLSALKTSVKDKDLELKVNQVKDIINQLKNLS
jgi:hypothetical protein